MVEWTEQEKAYMRDRARREAENKIAGMYLDPTCREAVQHLARLEIQYYRAMAFPCPT
jgi:hypothetical protein